MQLVYDLVKSGLTAKEIVNALLADEKLLLEKEKEIIVDFTLKHSDDKVEKIAYDYGRTFNISDKMKTPMQELIQSLKAEQMTALNEWQTGYQKALYNVIDEAESMLEKEKEVIMDAYDYGFSDAKSNHDHNKRILQRNL